MMLKSKMARPSYKHQTCLSKTMQVTIFVHTKTAKKRDIALIQEIKTFVAFHFLVSRNGFTSIHFIFTTNKSKFLQRSDFFLFSFKTSPVNAEFSVNIVKP